MIGRSSVRRRALPAALMTAVVVLLVAGTGQALATEPWWHIATISSPPGPLATQAMVTVDVANVGDAATAGTLSGNLAEVEAGESKHVVTVVDTLPVGVTPEGEAYIAGHGTDFAKNELDIERTLKRNLCSISGQVVTCEYVAPVRTYEHILIGILVKVAAGSGEGVNEATVSGSDTRPVVARHALALEGVGSYGVQSYELSPEEEGGALTRQAGKHPFQLTTTLMLNTHAVLVREGTQKQELQAEPVALTKDLRFNLPPGLVGNPTPLPKCSTYVLLQQFSNGSKHCPNDTVIGVAAPLTAYVERRVPYVELSAVYSLEPPVGEAAAFGFMSIVGPVTVDFSVSPGGGYDVVANVPDIPASVPFVGSVLTLWGVPADARHDSSRNLQCLQDWAPQESPSNGPEGLCPPEHGEQPLLTLPTSCTGPLRTSVQADSWSQIGQFTEPFEYASQNSVGEPYGLEGCNRLNFEPSMTVTPDGQEGSSPTGLTVGVHVAQEASLNPTGLAEATVKDTTVALPAGVALNPAGADGLLSCGLGEIGLSSPIEQSCPDAAKIGTLEIETPLLPNKLEGFAYLGAQEQNPFGSLIAMYIVAKDPVSGVLVKLAGEVTPCRQAEEVVAGVACQAPGQLISTFKETPQLPFENLRLHFFGGSRGPLATPAQCGSYSASASIAPWSGNPAFQVQSPPFAISSGPKTLAYPGGSPCPGSSLSFSPELSTGSLNLQAGAFTPFTMTMSREDGQQQLGAIQLHMPQGLSGMLSGVELCPEPQANEGLCGPNSLIGETTVSVGLGGDPYTVRGGKVYITGPYEGAPFGLSIVNPAKAGPFDLENTKHQKPACDCLVVRAKIEVAPLTAALTVTSDTSGEHAIPTILEGIPLQIKHVNVTIDRPGFTFNPTSCDRMAITGGLTSSQGATSALSVPFQVTNCASLAFKPSFKVSATGKTSRSRGAGLHVMLAYPRAPFGTQTNIRSVHVELPKALPSRLSTLNHACVDSVFDRDPADCPLQSRVGFAKATTPVLPVPLEGPAYFVSHGSQKFPELIVVLQGYGVTVYLRGETFINEKTAVTSSTFRSVPDVPVGSFELTLPQGTNSALAASRNLCYEVVKHRKRNVKRRVKLTMPTLFTAQNGDVLRRATAISVSGCKPIGREKRRKRRK